MEIAIQYVEYMRTHRGQVDKKKAAIRVVHDGGVLPGSGGLRQHHIHRAHLSPKDVSGLQRAKSKKLGCMSWSGLITNLKISSGQTGYPCVENGRGKADKMRV